MSYLNNWRLNWRRAHKQTPAQKITEYREDPTITERTIAALVSGVGTRVHIEREHDDPAINGLYMADADQIFLFKCKGEIPAVSVALEEAGHSLMRAEYLSNSKYAEEVRGKLEQWHPNAVHLIDWFEDARVYTQLGINYPGAMHALDTVWEKRRVQIDKHFVTITGTSTSIDQKTAHIVHEMLTEYLNSIKQYEARKPFESFKAILEYLDRFADQRPKNYPPQPKGYILIVGIPDDGKGNGGNKKGLTEADLKAIFGESGIHTIAVMIGAGAGNSAIGAEYQWPILQVVSLDD